MLSFMREQGIEGASAVPGRTSASAADPKQGGGNTGVNSQAPEQEYFTVASKGKDVRKSTYLLAGLFVIGVLSLFFMIKKITPKKAVADSSNATEIQFEAAISRLTGIKAEMFDRMDEIVNKFYEFSDVPQVRVNELAKNPFRHEAFWSNLKRRSLSDEQSKVDLARQQELALYTKQLQLSSIMRSSQKNCCMINDKILYEGDSIREFKVVQIGGNFVRLVLEQSTSEKVEIELKLSE